MYLVGVTRIHDTFPPAHLSKARHQPVGCFKFMHSSISRFEPGFLLVLMISNDTVVNEKIRCRIKRKTYKDIIIYKYSIDVVQPGFQQLVFYILNKITSGTVHKKTSSLLFLLFSKQDIFSMLAMSQKLLSAIAIKNVYE
jgi:hypothetical protein